MTRGQQRLRRQWMLIQLAASRQHGVRVRDLIEELGTSKSSFYRDLDVLRDAGVPIDTHNVNGEARVSLYTDVRLPPLAPTRLQVAALRLARRALAGLSGTGPMTALDELLDGYADRRRTRVTVVAPRARAAAPAHAARLDRAILGGRRCRIRYRGARDAAPRWRLLDPLALRWVDGHLYLVAHDADSSADQPKTFKLDRITAVKGLADKARAHAAYDEEAVFGRSVKTWTGEEIDVAVRLSPDVARFVGEYRLLPTQTIEDEPDGSVIVRARVAGIPETMRWVLSWGQDAEALEPPALRAAVQEQLTSAARRYAARKPVSSASARPTRAGTGAG